MSTTAGEKDAIMLSKNKSAVLQRIDTDNAIVQDWMQEHLGDSEEDFINNFLAFVKSYGDEIFSASSKDAKKPTWLVRTSAKTWEEYFSTNADLT
jgi:hypothetical protein